MAEKKYIEREALGIGKCNPDVFEDKGYAKGWNAAIDIVQSAPAANVRPVVRGRWIRHYEQADTGEDIITYPCGWVCSECGRWESEDEPFCNCGAQMEES